MTVAGVLDCLDYGAADCDPVHRGTPGHKSPLYFLLFTMERRDYATCVKMEGVNAASV